MITSNSILDYYSTPAPMTTGGSHSRRLRSLPEEIQPLVQAIQSLFIYDVVAKDFYNFDVPKARAGEIHIRPIEALIDRLIELDDAPLTQARRVEHRVIGRCNHFVLLTVAALRAHGLPARARYGFGAYFNPPKFEDHLVCEFFDSERGAWTLADVLFDDTWVRKLSIHHDILDVPRDQFLVASDAWRQCRTGERDANVFGIDFEKLRGLWFIAGSLIRDAASLNKIELLPWDTWGAMPKPNAQLSKEELAFFDELAELIRSPDATLDELQLRYSEDEKLRVPDMVFNALTKKLEPLGVELSPMQPSRSESHPAMQQPSR